MSRILSQVHIAAKEKILFLPHALQQMSKPSRMISALDIRHAISEGKVIEDYPDDPRGHSCLLRGVDISGRIIHVVCAPKDGFLAIITAYVPDPTQWDDDFRERR